MTCLHKYNKLFCLSVIIKNYFRLENLFFWTSVVVFSQGWAWWVGETRHADADKYNKFFLSVENLFMEITVIFLFHAWVWKVSYNSRQYIWNKIEKSSKTGQPKKSLISTFVCFLTAVAKRRQLSYQFCYTKNQVSFYLWQIRHALNTAWETIPKNMIFF